MTQEDKELILKDLCARLPYGVKGQAKGMIKFFADEEVSEEPWTLTNINVQLNTFGADTQTCIPLFNRRLGKCNFKPYLLPLSSMTEEQKKEQEAHFTCIKHDMSFSICRYMEWCYKNHLDVNGLLPKGLAIDATGLNVY